MGPVGPAWTAEPVGVMVQQPDVSQLLFSGGDWILNLGWLKLGLFKKVLPKYFSTKHVNTVIFYFAVRDIERIITQ